MISDFKLTYCAMVDEDYEYEEYDTDFVRLDGYLENELEKLGWPRRDGSKIEEEECYEFISSLLNTQDGEEAIRKSVFWAIVKKISSSLGMDLEKMTSSLNEFLPLKGT